MGNKEIGAAANHGAHVVVNLCETQRNQRGGIMVLRNATVKATDCTSFDDQARHSPAPNPFFVVLRTSSP